jgi:mRNA interferase MazF
MKVKQFDIWIADLSPQIGTETGKAWPVLIIQTDLLNKALFPSTIICPITTNIKSEAEILRVHIEKNVANVQEKSDVMIDQIRAIDNKRLIKKIGKLPQNLVEKVKENIKIVLDVSLLEL